MKSALTAVVGALMLLALTFAVVSRRQDRREVPTSQTPGEAGPTTAPSSVVELTHYLPLNAVSDGSIDYTASVQRALDAARGRTLRLAPFPVLVAPAPGRNYCLSIKSSIQIVGGPGCELRTTTPAVQLLRIEATAGILLDGFSLRGVGGVGRNLHHGLLQVWNCANLEVRGVRIVDADADALAVANSRDVRILGCSIERGSKAGIYVTACDDVVVDGNLVANTVGHFAPNGSMVGAGILLLSNIDTVCSNNVVERAVGVGIACGSNDRQRAPDGVLIVGNRVRGVSNPSNPATSGGIALANSQGEKRTHVLVASNSLRDCGQHAILVENHDGAVIQGNSIVASHTSAIVVGHSRAVSVLDNVLTDVNFERRNGQAGVFLHAHTSGCLVRGTVMVDLAGQTLPALIDRAPTGVNRAE